MDGDRVKELHVILDLDLHTAFAVKTKQRGTTMAAVIRQKIRQYLANEKETAP